MVEGVDVLFETRRADVGFGVRVRDVDPPAEQRRPRLLRRRGFDLHEPDRAGFGDSRLVPTALPVGDGENEPGIELVTERGLAQHPLGVDVRATAANTGL